MHFYFVHGRFVPYKWYWSLYGRNILLQSPSFKFSRKASSSYSLKLEPPSKQKMKAKRKPLSTPASPSRTREPQCTCMTTEQYARLRAQDPRYKGKRHDCVMSPLNYCNSASVFTKSYTKLCYWRPLQQTVTTTMWMHEIVNVMFWKDRSFKTYTRRTDRLCEHLYELLVGQWLSVSNWSYVHEMLRKDADVAEDC